MRPSREPKSEGSEVAAPEVETLAGSPDASVPDEVHQAWTEMHLAAIEACIKAALPRGELEPSALFEALAYASLGGGKRIRALLCLASGEACAAHADYCLKAATAIELIHAYSLVHDDMPCMDNDVLRRGKPTVHVAYGEATAMLVGDGLQALAFEVLAGMHQAGLAASQCLLAVDLLARASGPTGMVGGQAIDLALLGEAASFVDLDKLHHMHRLKTGALLKASVQMGLCCGQLSDMNAEASHCLEQYAAQLGLAFQVIDDVLDVSATTESLGKTAGKDRAQEKPTFVSLMGLQAAREFAFELHREAIASLAQARRAEPRLVASGLDRLAGLADLIVLRRH